MLNKFTQKQIIIMGGAALVVIVVFFVLVLNIRSKSASQTSATLTVWGTDSPKAFNDMLAAYDGPGASSGSHITYTQVDASDYQSKILAALAAGDGPDIFEIGNRDLPQWQSVITPIPASLATTFNEVTLENDFPTVVDQDFVSGGNIYALPLSIDTLAMIYNKDLFDTAGIATIPKTWEDFQNDVPALRQVNAQGQITQAAAALGGSEASIADAPDILFLLMLQNGTQMVSTGDSSVTFASGDNTGPGPSAFNYYLQFGDATSPYYTWNDNLGSDIDSFAQGTTAVIFDYSSALADIKTKAPFLNYGVAAMPQPANATVVVSYAKYQGLAVSRDSANVLAAWNLIISLTTSPADEKLYTDDMASPPALRTSIAADLTDPTMSVFASQALTARSWSESNSESIDSITNTAILNVLNGAADSTDALSQAQTAINSL